MIHPEANNEELNMVQLDLRNIMILNEIITQRKIGNELPISNLSNFRNVFLNNLDEEETSINTLNIEINGEYNQNNSNNRFCPINEIKDILKELFPQCVIDRIKNELIIKEDIEILQNPKNLFVTIKKREKGRKISKKCLQCGRKKKGENIKAKHNKNSSDNIIRKIKVYFFKNLIIFINTYISKERKLVNLDYEYISNLKKDFNIEILNTSLEKILSQKISTKYGQNNEYYDKNIIANILEKEANIEKIKRLLQMKFIDWIDIFLFKKKEENEIKCNGLYKTLIDIINKNSDDDSYLTRFVLYLYNYKLYFQNKKGRNEKNY